MGGCARQLPAHSQRARIAASIGVRIPHGARVRYSDTHGGFMGDGVTYAEVSFADAAQAEDFAWQLPRAEGWQALPLAHELQEAMYGSFALARQVQMPEVRQGYYYFYDRYADMYPGDAAPLLERPALNFTLAVFDSDHGVLYFYSIDT